MKPETSDNAPIVKAWLDEPVWLPESDLGRLAAIVHQTPQQRRWLPTFDRRSFSMSTVTTFVVAGAIAALVGGYVLSGAVAPQPDQPLPPGAELTSPLPVVAETSAAPSATPGTDRGGAALTANDLVLDPPSGATVGGWTEIGRKGMTGETDPAYGELRQLTVLGDRLVALGSVGMFEGPTREYIYVSTDGLTWEATSDRVFGNPRFTDLAPTSTGVLAAGSVRGEDGREARLWSSTDGVTWTVVAEPRGREVAQIVSAESPLVVRVGERVWVNRDGTTWERGTRLVNAEMKRGPGGFLTVHNIGTGSFPMLTLSEDLTDSVEVAGAPDALEEGDPAFYGVVVFPLADQWVMVSNQVVTPDVIWTSPDGLNWTEVPRPVGMTDEYVRWIANVGDEVQAFGNLMTDEGTPTGLWSWQLGEEAPAGLPLDASGDVFINEPVAFGDGYVATGLDRGRGSGVTVWRYEPPATS